MTKKDFMEFLDHYNKDAGEFTEAELYEIGCKYKELPTSQKRWNELVEILGVEKTGEQFRIWIKDKQYADETIKHNEQLISDQTIDSITFEDFEEQTQKIKQDLYIQAVKTRDERNAFRKTLRDEARIQEIKDMMVEAIKDLKDLPEVKTVPRFKGEKEAVLLFSDLHIGAVVDSFYNKYNVEIARRRVQRLIDSTIEYCRANDVVRLHVLNLGDNIMGSIHLTGRIESEQDVITQTMTAAEIIADSLNQLQAAAPEVCYRSCSDNHGRITPNLKEHIEIENFGRLIDFYLKARLQDSSIIWGEDNLDIDIGMFKLLNGKHMAFVHGHRDKDFARSIMGISSTTDTKIDYLCLGHYHSTGLKTIQGTTVFINASIMGADSYASSVRLYGPAAQTLLIFDGDNTFNININLDNA